MSTPPLPPATGLIDFALHPPLGLLQPYLDYYGPYTGNNTITHWARTPGPIFQEYAVRASYGVQLHLNGVLPTGWGFYSGWTDEDGLYEESVYDPPLAQLVVQHQFTNGAWATTQRLEVSTVPSILLWEVALPGRLGLLVAPQIAVDLFFLNRLGE